jgi:hypothetical protein
VLAAALGLLARDDDGDKEKRSPGSVAASVRITEPDGGSIGYPIEMEGQITGDLQGQELYAVARREGAGSYQPRARPCEVDSTGRFGCPNFYVGVPGDSGVEFVLYVVLADNTGAQAFEDYEQRADQNEHSGFPTLPTGTVIADQVTVERE